MLGNGLESLIPPQKPNSSGGSSDIPSTQSQAPMPAAKEERLDPIPQTPSEPSTPSEGPPSPQPEEPVFLPEETEEKLLPEAPPAMIHQEDRSSEPQESQVVTPPPSQTPTPQVVEAPSYSPSPSIREESAHFSPRPELKRPTAVGEAVFLVEVDKIQPNPHQPRRHFDENALRDLAASIREHGILQPLVVTKVESEVPGGTAVEYQLIAGERRLKASKLVGLERVPVIVRSLDQGMNQSLELAIIENLQRENLNPIEMARAFARLQDEFRMTQREIATRLGKSRETVANTLRLLDLPFDVQESIATGKISESHGRLLLSLKDPAVQEKLFRDLVSKNLTTRELRAKVEAGGEIHHREKKATPEVQMFQEKLASFLGTPVKINQTGESGRITINFYSHEELENILEHLSRVLGNDEENI